jgi:hypothetical protein
MTQITAPARPTFLSAVGSVLLSVVKHVPTRGALWGVIGFFVGLVAVTISMVIGVLVLDRASMLLGYLVAIPIAIPFLGAALFFVHGLHRGAARAALELERKFGLVRYVVDRVIGLLARHVGGPVSNLPLAEVERRLKAAVDEYLGSDDMREGSGLGGWILRRAKRSIVRRIDRYLLAAYRAEERPDGSGGGVSLEKVGARVSHEMSTRLGEIVMSPLNKQLAVFMILYVALGVGWWALLFGVMSLFTRR